MTQLTGRRSGLATAFAIPDVETPRGRAGSTRAASGAWEGKRRASPCGGKGARARRVFCAVVVGALGYVGAEAVRFLGVTTASVNRLAVSEELPEVRKYRNAL